MRTGRQDKAHSSVKNTILGFVSTVAACPWETLPEHLQEVGHPVLDSARRAGRDLTRALLMASSDAVKDLQPSAADGLHREPPGQAGTGQHHPSWLQCLQSYAPRR